MDNFLLQTGDDEWLLDASFTATLPFPIAILNSKGKLLYTNYPSATVLYRLQASSPCQPQLVQSDEQVRVYRCLGGLSYLATRICPQGGDVYELLCEGAKLASSKTYGCPAQTPEGVIACCQTAPLLLEQEFTLRQQQLLQIAQELTALFDKTNERQLGELQAQLLRSVTSYPHRLTPSLLCNMLAKTLVQLPGIICGAAALVEPETGQIGLLATQGSLPSHLPLDVFCTGLASRVIYEGKTRVLKNPTTDPTIPLLTAEEAKAYIGQVACSPVQVQGKTVALLFAGCPPQATVDVVRVEALSSLTKLAALQFDRLHSQHRLLAQQRVAAAIEQLYATIDAQADVKSLLSTCLDLATAMLDVDKIYIRLTSKQDSSWAQRGLDQDTIDVLKQVQMPDHSIATEFPLRLRHKTLGFLGIINCDKALVTTTIEQLCRLMAMPIFSCLALAPQTGNRDRDQDNLPLNINKYVKLRGKVHLTRREQQVLALTAKGYSNKEIANALAVTEKTAKVHLSNIMRKLDATDRTSAVVKALQQGLINPILKMN